MLKTSSCFFYLIDGPTSQGLILYNRQFDLKEPEGIDRICGSRSYRLIENCSQGNKKSQAARYNKDQ